MGNIEIPFVGGAYTARSKDLNAQVCQNLYVEVDNTGAKAIIALVGTPGALLWKDMAVSGEVRAFGEFNGFLYVIVGNTVYRLNAARAKTSIGTIGTSEGWVKIITDDITYMTMYDFSGGWTWDGSTFAPITAAWLPNNPTGATYQDGYQIVTRGGTDQVFFSDQDNPTSGDATVFIAAEGAGDDLVAPISVERQLWLIGVETSEIYFNAGRGSPPFERNPGGFMRIGCNARRSIANYEDDLMFLSDKNQVVRKQGLQLVPASTYQIDFLIGTMTVTSDAVGFMYFQEGHVFYELTFPSDNTTICYDLTASDLTGTRQWHTRATGTSDNRSPANSVIRFNDQVLVGDFNNGRIYEYDLTTFTDNGDVKRAIRAAQPLNERNQLMFFSSFELDMETGVGNGDVEDPQIILQYSNDGGHTWSNERWKSMGKIGEYGKRIRWNQLGSSRNRIFRILISDPAKRNIFDAYLRGSLSNA